MMNKFNKLITFLLMITLLFMVLSGCTGIDTNLPEFKPTPDTIVNFDLDNKNAQATMDYGQRQLLELSRRSTEVNQDMVQAANAAAQTTMEYNQNQQMELDFQATSISLNITHAAATQEFLAQETRVAAQATEIAEHAAETATQNAYLVYVNQTARAQATTDAKIQQTNEAVVAMTVYPMTATPMAMTKAALIMQQYGRERQAFENQIITPLLPFIILFVVLLTIVVIILAYRRFMTGSWTRLLRISGGFTNPNPPVSIDGVIMDVDEQTRPTIPSGIAPVKANLPSKNLVQVEIVDPTHPSVSLWIIEVEQQLDIKGRVKS